MALSRDIVFSRARVGERQKEVFILDTNGILTRVTFGTGIYVNANDKYDSADADWSADKNWLVFDSTRDDTSPKNDSDIYKIQLADLNNVPRLTTNLKSIDPNWSKSNGKIIYDSEFSGKYGIFIMDNDGNNKQSLITENDEYSAKWSPDGTKIVFHRSGSNGITQIVLADYPNVSNQLVLTNSDADSSPSFSRDGSQVFFSRIKLPYTSPTRELYKIYVDGSGLTKLMNSAYGVYNDAPNFSPDSENEKIVFNSNRKWNGSQIYEMNPDGTNIQTVTNDSGFDHYSPIYKPV